MEEIKIYNSAWRGLLLHLGCLVCCAISVFLIYHPENIFHLIIGWVGVVFFVFGYIIILLDIAIQSVTGQPFMTITDKDIILHGRKQTVIKFADVESFSVVKMNKQKFIVIHYKPNVERTKMDKAGTFGRFIRSINYMLVGGQETISTIGTSMDTQELCNMLNERLK